MSRFLLMKSMLPLSLLLAAPAVAEETEPAWPEAWFEIFKLAPGQHEAFMRDIALGDQVLEAGGQPPVQLFIHEYGAEWDVIVFKPVTGWKPTPSQEKAMAAKAKELSVPSGPAYFINIRSKVASHTDTKTVGPVSAAAWLERLAKWRSENPPRSPRK